MGERRTLIVRPRDPLLVRDARPFSNDPGGRADSLRWPLPQTLAGALRTHIGNTTPGHRWDHDGAVAALNIALQGPFLLARHDEGDWQVYLPAPRDAVPYEDANDDDKLKLMRLKPMRVEAGSDCNLPHTELSPLAVALDVKPAREIDYWPFATLDGWLADPDSTTPPCETLPHLPQETRTHVAINKGTGSYEEGMLFSTRALVFADRTWPIKPELDDEGEPATRKPATAMLCRVELPKAHKYPELAGWEGTEGFLTFGGERRVSAVCNGSGDLWPASAHVPAADADGKLAVKRLRLYLATPAIFRSGGWLPDWIDPDTLTGAPEWLGGVTLKLEAAAIDRRVPTSGWDIRRSSGARGTRYAVPAGSVYFFSVVENDLTAEHWEKLWLNRSLCRNPYDARNGYGLTLPGVWNWDEGDE